LAYKGYKADFVPCTAQACLELLRREHVPLSGANVVVLGRSAIVGMFNAFRVSTISLFIYFE
jgi:5,10-methylene-tetrahydrofolate dehydrogenase/methenyl tetrahydrofolate cyclohydrolase